VRVVVVGATGNTGTAVLRRLAATPEVEEIVGVARRTPPPWATEPYAGVRWVACDVGDDRAPEALAEAFHGATAVIQLAWQIQPSHDPVRLYRTNVTGTGHVARAAVRAGVGALVVASSVGAYAPGPKDSFVAEDWPVTGVPGSGYSDHKARIEALLDEVAADSPRLRVVRLRPGLVFQRAAGGQIARYFLGPWAPVSLLRFGRVPVVPRHPRLRAQCVHADDLADAYVRAVRSDVRGAFNVATEPVLDGELAARALHGRTVPVAPGLLLAAAAATWYARLQPTDPGWVRLAAGAPLMQTGRIRSELGWAPTRDSAQALGELLAGLAEGGGRATAALRPRVSVAARVGHTLQGRLPGQGDPY
jgi:UDP-glucose 4-epimerase